MPLSSSEEIKVLSPFKARRSANKKVEATLREQQRKLDDSIGFLNEKLIALYDTDNPLSPIKVPLTRRFWKDRYNDHRPVKEFLPALIQKLEAAGWKVELKSGWVSKYLLLKTPPGTDLMEAFTHADSDQDDV